MRVIATGPESSGTKLMARLLDHSPHLTALHRSMPHGGLAERHWPTDQDFDEFKPDAVVAMRRDKKITAISQVRTGHVVNVEEAYRNIQMANQLLHAWLARTSVPAFQVSYGGLVRNPDRTVGSIFARLRLPYPGLAEPVTDEDAKYGLSELAL